MSTAAATASTDTPQAHLDSRNVESKGEEAAAETTATTTTTTTNTNSSTSSNTFLAKLHNKSAGIFTFGMTPPRVVGDPPAPPGPTSATDDGQQLSGNASPSSSSPSPSYSTTPQYRTAAAKQRARLALLSRSSSSSSGSNGTTTATGSGSNSSASSSSPSLLDAIVVYDIAEEADRVTSVPRPFPFAATCDGVPYVQQVLSQVTPQEVTEVAGGGAPSPTPATPTSSSSPLPPPLPLLPPVIHYRCIPKYDQSSLTQLLRGAVAGTEAEKKDGEEDAESNGKTSTATTTPPNTSNRSFIDATVFAGAAASTSTPTLSLEEAYQLHHHLTPTLPLGAIAIAERHTKKKDEHLRMLHKQLQGGCTFFITQCVYNSEATKNMLEAYSQECQRQQVEMCPILVTFSPCGSKRMLDFFHWLGVQPSEYVEADLLRAAASATPSSSSASPPNKSTNASSGTPTSAATPTSSTANSSATSSVGPSVQGTPVKAAGEAAAEAKAADAAAAAGASGGNAKEAGAPPPPPPPTTTTTTTSAITAKAPPSTAVLDESVALILELWRELISFALRRGIPLGCNIESVGDRKVDVTAAVSLVSQTQAIMREEEERVATMRKRAPVAAAPAAGTPAAGAGPAAKAV